VEDCVRVTCANGGTCIDDVHGYHCQCIAGFIGDDCETNINECASAPCLNDGLCEDSIDGYICRCKEGFEGLACGLESSELSLDPLLAIIVTGSVGLCFSFLLCAILHKKMHLSQVIPIDNYS
jgi:hypothetical protein